MYSTHYMRPTTLSCTYRLVLHLLLRYFISVYAPHMSPDRTLGALEEPALRVVQRVFVPIEVAVVVMIVVVVVVEVK